eukprot:gene32240-41786_t
MATLIQTSRDGSCKEMAIIFDTNLEIDVNATDEGGWTALMYSIHRGQVETVKLLLDRGANVDARNVDGWSPLWIAAHYGHVEILKMLLAKGAKIESTDNDGWTALISAAASGQTNAVACLLQEGANVEARDEFGNTALMKAACRGHWGTTKLLLEKGATRDATDGAGKTAVEIAGQYHHWRVVQLLRTGKTQGADSQVRSSPSGGNALQDGPSAEQDSMGLEDEIQQLKGALAACQSRVSELEGEGLSKEKPTPKGESS